MQNLVSCAPQIKDDHLKCINAQVYQEVTSLWAQSNLTLSTDKTVNNLMLPVQFMPYVSYETICKTDYELILANIVYRKTLQMKLKNPQKPVSTDDVDKSKDGPTEESKESRLDDPFTGVSPSKPKYPEYSEKTATIVSPVATRHSSKKSGFNLTDLLTQSKDDEKAKPRMLDKQLNSAVYTTN